MSGFWKEREEMKIFFERDTVNCNSWNRYCDFIEEIKDSNTVTTKEEMTITKE